MFQIGANWVVLKQWPPLTKTQEQPWAGHQHEELRLDHIGFQVFERHPHASGLKQEGKVQGKGTQTL